ncbi:MAG: esterase family protein [Henriciella sp.]|nr:esterase family protein [Henriciella sp.]
MWIINSILSGAVLLFVAACGGAAPTASEDVSQPAEASPTPAPEPGPAETPRALVSEHSLETALMAQPVSYHVFLPPSYADTPDARYPVIYWLHGSGGFPPGMLQGLSGRFNGAMVQNKMPEALVVFPDGLSQSNWVNSRDGQVPMEDIIIQELIPKIEADYRVIASADGRLIEGGSMGGYGAARFGLKYPDMFAAISMLNPGPMQSAMDVDNAPIVGRERAQQIFDTVYGGDQDYFQAQSPWQLATAFTETGPHALEIRLILGANDPIAAVNQDFSAHLDSLSIEHELILLEDAGHNPRQMFAALGEDYWDFFGILEQSE